MLRKLTAGLFAVALIFLILGCSGDKSSAKKEDGKKSEDGKKGGDGSGEGLDSTMKDTMNLQVEYVEILEGIKNKDDIAKAKSKVEDLQKKATAIGERMKQHMKDLKPEEALKKFGEAMSKHEEEGKKLEERMNKAKESVKKAAGGTTFPKELDIKPPSPQ